MVLARQPDPADFDGVFREHAPALLRLLRARVGDADAPDVLQETFLRFLRFYVLPGRLDPGRPVRPLLVVIASREAARHGMARGRQRRLDFVGPATAAPDAVGSDEHVQALDLEPIVRAVLAELEPRQRRLLLQWEARRSTQALASSEEVSGPALKQVVVRARRRFRERYLETGGFAAALLLRIRLRLQPDRGDTVAVGFGLVACSVAVVVAVGSGPAPSRATEVASRATAPAPAPALQAKARVPLAVVTRIGPAVAATDPNPSRRSETTVPSRSRIQADGVSIDLTADDSQGSTRSINSLTVQCEAGITGTTLCTAIDVVPSGRGHP